MSEPEVTVTVRMPPNMLRLSNVLPPIVTGPVPRLRFALPVPRYVKLPFHACGLLPESVRLAVASSTPPLITNWPVLRAESLPRVSVPELSVVGPE